MAESSQSASSVRDLTAASRQIPIEIEGSVAFEVIMAIWSAFSPKETNTARDLGEAWLERVRDATSPELAEELKTLGGPYCYVWLSISSLLLSAPHPHDPDRVFQWLESVENLRLRRWILGHAAHSDDQALIERAASGDIEAVKEMVEGPKKDFGPAMVGFAESVLFQDELPKRYASAIERFRTEVFAEFEEEFAAAIGRCAAARRAAPTRGSAAEVVEEVTSGIEFNIPLGITRIALIPSVVTRPLSLIDQARGTLIVYFGVADEFIDSDPESPPSWLVRSYKALGDERRLRILRRLSEGETTLDELTEMLGLSKSTVHHHISLLRGAGLVRVRVDREEAHMKTRYTLRRQALVDTGGFLDSYLRADEGEQSA